MAKLNEFEAVEAQCHKVANDTLRCDVGLMFAPHVIALTSIIVGMELMGRGEEMETWLVELETDFEKVGKEIGWELKLLTSLGSVHCFCEKHFLNPLFRSPPAPKKSTKCTPCGSHSMRRKKSKNLSANFRNPILKCNIRSTVENLETIRIFS